MKKKSNLIVYQKAPFDETSAAEKLQELLTNKVTKPGLKLEFQPDNKPFKDPKTGEWVQTITIVISAIDDNGNCK